MAIHNTADNSFKLIFDDHRLFADFLRDFVGLDILKDVRAEDIEDMRERFIPLFQEQRDSDTVKRISLKGNAPFFVIAILEHQSQVNFRSCFKMLQYITLVLHEWEKEVEKQKLGSILLKDFRYPPVLPIILYDGRGAWTAQRSFLERTQMNSVFGKYIPKFEYEVVNLNDYSEDKIMRFGGALSFVFLIDKLRTGSEKFRDGRLPEDYVEKLRLQIPDNMVKLLVDITSSFLDKGGYGHDETESVIAIVEKAKSKEYGGMFEVARESLIEGGIERGIIIGKENYRDEIREEVREELRDEIRDGLLTENQIETARKALAEGLSFDLVSRITGLDLETISGLSKAKS